MTNFKSILLILSGVFVLHSCSPSEEDTPPHEETYEGGLFVLNEGVWQSGNASISFLGSSRQEMAHQIFQTENEAELLGDVGQNMEIYGDHIYIVVNGSNKVEVVDRFSFEQVATWNSQLQNPRDINFSEGKAFVSNWGDGSVPDDDFVAVYNTSDFSYLDKISVGEGPEEVVAGNGYIVTSHIGGFGTNTIISIVDPVNLNVVKTLEVGDRPNTMVFVGEQLYVLAEGKLSWTGEESAGQLTEVDMSTLEVDRQLVFPSVSDHPTNLSESEGRIFYTLGKDLYGFQTSESSLPQEPLFTMGEVDVLYGLTIQDSEVFATSANVDFSSNGKLLIYDFAGQLLHQFETGINPNGVLLNL